MMKEIDEHIIEINSHGSPVQKEGLTGTKNQSEFNNELNDRTQNSNLKGKIGGSNIKV